MTSEQYNVETDEKEFIELQKRLDGHVLFECLCDINLNIVEVMEYLKKTYTIIEQKDLEWLMAELYPTHFNHKKYNEIVKKRLY